MTGRAPVWRVTACLCVASCVAVGLSRPAHAAPSARLVPAAGAEAPTPLTRDELTDLSLRCNEGRLLDIQSGAAEGSSRYRYAVIAATLCLTVLLWSAVDGATRDKFRVAEEPEAQPL
jgi:hypothetical protein